MLGCPLWGMAQREGDTKSMADRPYAEAMNDEADGLVEQYWKRAEQIYESVMGRYT